MSTDSETGRPEVAASGEEASFPAVRTLRFTVDGAGDCKREYEAVAVQFANAWQLFLTYSGKVGTWLCASADAPHADVYSVKTLIGDRLQEHLAVYARSLVKTLCDSLRTRSSLELDREIVLILAIDVHDDRPETFQQILKALADIFKP